MNKITKNKQQNKDVLSEQVGSFFKDYSDSIEEINTKSKEINTEVDFDTLGAVSGAVSTVAGNADALTSLSDSVGKFTSGLFKSTAKKTPTYKPKTGTTNTLRNLDGKMGLGDRFTSAFD